MWTGSPGAEAWGTDLRVDESQVAQPKILHGSGHVAEVAGPAWSQEYDPHIVEKALAVFSHLPSMRIQAHSS